MSILKIKKNEENNLVMNEYQARKDQTHNKHRSLGIVNRVKHSRCVPGTKSTEGAEDIQK